MLISKRDLSVEASRSRAFLIFRVYIYSVMVKPVSDLKRADNWLRLRKQGCRDRLYGHFLSNAPADRI